LAEQHSQELETANALLQATNAELDAFAHTVAHDLKSPLGIITSYSDFLFEVGSDMRPDELNLIFGELQKSGYKATNIIEELLLLASVRKGSIKLKPLDMTQIVEGAQRRIRLMIQEYQAEIIHPPNWPQAQGYGPWVEEVWVNYLSNGLKYGGEPPRLELGATPQKDGMIRFWVRDNGPGLTPEARIKLFAEFTRLDEVRAQGHGLGLSIVRRIVEKLGGQVGVESEGVPGRGSTFYFTLPAV
jgi:signal transduction histidine kinase